MYFLPHITLALTQQGYVLSVLAKKTYTWHGRTVKTADEALPIADDIVVEENSNRNSQVVTQGRDTWPIKVATDIVLRARAWPVHGRAMTTMGVAISVGRYQKKAVVFGHRYTELVNGSFRFSQPENIESVELSYWNAYGGMDPTVFPSTIDKTPIFAGKPVLELCPGTYPRNPAGTGYLIHPTPEILDGMELPCIEDMDNLLTPSSLLTPDPSLWWQKPLPAGFGWMHPLTFPRSVHCGATPFYSPTVESVQRHLGRITSPDLKNHIAEVSMGLIEAEQLERQPLVSPLNLRMTSEASPGLIVPFLTGNEDVRISGCDPYGEILFTLPNERPRVDALCENKSLGSGSAFLHTLCIDTENKNFYMLWSIRFLIPTQVWENWPEDPQVDDIAPAFTVRLDDTTLPREAWPTGEPS